MPLLEQWQWQWHRLMNESELRISPVEVAIVLVINEVYEAYYCLKQTHWINSSRFKSNSWFLYGLLWSLLFLQTTPKSGNQLPASDIKKPICGIVFSIFDKQKKINAKNTHTHADYQNRSYFEIFTDLFANLQSRSCCYQLPTNQTTASKNKQVGLSQNHSSHKKQHGQSAKSS